METGEPCYYKKLIKKQAHGAMLYVFIICMIGVGDHLQILLVRF